MSLPIVSMVLLPFVLSFAAPAEEGPNGIHGVQVTLLASESILLQSGGSSVLIDAFIEPRRAGSAQASPAAQGWLAPDPPFASVQLALVTHAHLEHFHPETAGAFLRMHPETTLASSADVLQAMREGYPEYAAIEDQLTEVEPDEGEIADLVVAGIRVEFLALRHEASEFYPERVLGHVVHLGRKSLLFIGDSEMRPENWDRYDLKSKRIDIAIVPFWLFKEEVTRSIINEYIAPDRLAVIQIPPPGRRGIVSELSRRFPDVVFLSEAMASTEF